MPDFTFTFTIQDITPQRATAISNRIQQRLGDDGIVVASVNSARRTQPFRVLGVDTATGVVFDATVDADTKDAAIAAVVGSNSTRVVALCQP